jgi:hypothetical protein
LKWTIGVVGVLALAYASFVGFASYSSGAPAEVTFKLGTLPGGKMYLRCADATGGSCSGGDQGVFTVRERARVMFHVHNDDSGDHSHDFKLGGWQYALPPISPESELHQADESWTFTAWAPGTFRLWCEIGGHAAAGMEGKLVVA